jgi:hypothetical protein
MATVDQAIACDDRIRDQSNVLAQLEAANPNIDQAVEHAEATVTAAADGVSAKAAVVEGLRDTVDTMSNAIASIATHCRPMRLPALRDPLRQRFGSAGAGLDRCATSRARASRPGRRATQPVGRS